MGRKYHISLFFLLFLSGVAQSQLRPVFWWQCDSGDVTYNHNPATLLDSGQSLVFDSIPYYDEYTVMVVYHTMGEEMELPVWEIRFNDSVRCGLTTRNIHHGQTSIQYIADNRQGPVINTLQQSVPDGLDSTQRYCRLTLGSTADQSTHIKVAEVMYFAGKPAMGLLRRVQSCLAIKYGVTLGPVNYSDSHGKVLWRYGDNAAFHHRITGVGKDSVYGLAQKISISQNTGSIITLGCDSLIEGRFCLLGDNGGPLAYTMDSISGMEYLGRIWKVNQTLGTNVWDTTLYSIEIDTSLLPGNSDSLVLMVNSEYHFPDSIVDGRLHYGNIAFSSDSTFMALARGAFLWNMAEGKTKQTQSSAGALAGISTRVYPNPSDGHYTIEVSGAEEVTVKIHNALGVELTEYYDKEKYHYTFSGTLPGNNVYYVTITTDGGSQTMKLIVK